MKKAWDKIRDIIRKDAKAQHEYKDANGDTCVLGGLAEAAGISVSRRSELNGANIGTHSRLEKSLLAAYPVLTGYHLDILQSENDSYYDVRDRRARLLFLIDKFEKEAVNATR